MVIDGIWFKKEMCLNVYWDSDLECVQWWRYTTAERADEILEDIKTLKLHGVTCASITSDGGTGIKAAVVSEYQAIPHQRCLVHVRRLALAWLTRKPKTMAGIQLRRVVLELSRVQTIKQRGQWIESFVCWDNEWKEFLKERSWSPDGKHWWYTHRYLRKVRSLINHAIPELFWYLEDEDIPRDTNGLEGRFSSLKQHYRQHRGLSKKRRKAYLAWYLMVNINDEITNT